MKRLLLAATAYGTAVFLFPAYARAQNGPSAGADNNIRIIKEQTICAEPGRYLGWPTLALINNGQLMVAYSGDRDAHVCPYGKNQLITSDDMGQSWTAPRTINSTQLDDRDAGLVQTKKGTLILSWFTSLTFEDKRFPATYNKYYRVGQKIPADVKKQLLGNWTRRSDDLGKTWQTAVRTTVTSPHGPINLKNGDLLYVGTVPDRSGNKIFAEISKDDGRSWKVLSEIPRDENYMKGLSEPHVVQLKSGKLLAMVRHEPSPEGSYMLQSESTDGGKTWTRMVKTPIWGYPPHLIQLNNGWLLASYGYRKPPFGERACFSKDEGKTWDLENEIVLSTASNGDLGYPSSVQLPDSSILTVYYQSPGPGQLTVLKSTHWKISGQ